MYKLLFSPKGSIRRMQFFLGTIAIAVITMACTILLTPSVAPVSPEEQAAAVAQMKQAGVAANKEGKPTSAAEFYAPIYRRAMQAANTSHSWQFIPVLLFSLYTSACLYLKRLRDLAVSPWLAIVPLLAQLGVSQQNFLNMPVLNLSLMTVSAIFFFVCVLYPSRVGHQYK